MALVSSVWFLVTCCGCIGGSLATTTGPRVSGEWSTASHQAAHVGETVKYSFVLAKPFAKHPIHPAGIAEYCVLELADRPIEMEVDEQGRFAASYVMPAEWANREIKVKATAYRQYGQRDRIVHQNQVLLSDRPDPADRALAKDALTMLVYQSSVEIKVDAEGGALDFNGAHLVLRKSDDTTAMVPKAGARGGGFRVDDPGGDGAVVVRYEPSSGQVNLTGLTEAELTVHDRAGRPHHQRVSFMTP